MNERTYTGQLPDAREWGLKENWGDGPWQDEPDKVVWVDDSTGLDCMALRGPQGAWCGYVGVPEGHPWWEADPFELDALAHGGLNFGGHCEPDTTEDMMAVCHNPEGRPPNVWWVGFDCGHSRDICPLQRAFERHVHTAYGIPLFERLEGMGWVYRDLAYVKKVIILLALQARDADASR